MERAPELIYASPHLTVTEGQNVTLTCLFSAKSVHYVTFKVEPTEFFCSKFVAAAPSAQVDCHSYAKEDKR